jgi:hypothetical protein
MASPNQYGSFRFSAWAILTNLVNNFVGLLTLTTDPVNGTSGSFAGKAGPGTVVINITTGVHFINIGTKASPLWFNSGGPVASGIAGGNVGGGLASVGNAKMTYSFAVDGGAIATITPTNSPTLPVGAIILGGVIDITTTLTSGGAATIALGFGSGAQVAALKGATAVASWTAGLTLPLIPIFTAATYYKLTAAARMTLTVAAATLTAGVMDVNLVYVQGNS